MIDSRNAYWSDNSDGQFIGSEISFEYRVYLLLANGTILEQQAGQAGFIPASVPFSSTEGPVVNPGGVAQYNTTLKGRRSARQNDDWDPAPACVSHSFRQALQSGSNDGLGAAVVHGG